MFSRIRTPVSECLKKNYQRDIFIAKFRMVSGEIHEKPQVGRGWTDARCKAAF